MLISNLWCVLQPMNNTNDNVLNWVIHIFWFCDDFFLYVVYMVFQSRMKFFSLQDSWNLWTIPHYPVNTRAVLQDIGTYGHQKSGTVHSRRSDDDDKENGWNKEKETLCVSFLSRLASGCSVLQREPPIHKITRSLQFSALFRGNVVYPEDRWRK